MKRLILMAASALLLTMTQCRKDAETLVTPSDGVKITVTANPGRVAIDGGTGAISWSADKVETLYVSDGMNWVTTLTNNGEGGNVFTGNLLSYSKEKTYHFFYFGQKLVPGVEANTETSVTVWLKYQAGTLEDAGGYQVGYGSSTGQEAGSISVTLTSKLALARIDFTKDGAASKGAVKLGDANGNLVNEVTVSPVVTDGKVTIATAVKGDIYLYGTTEGKTKYVVLAPTDESVEMCVNGEETSAFNFDGGIGENKYYGMSKPLEAAFTKEFERETVKIGDVEWSACNLGANTPTECGDYFQWGKVQNVTKTGNDTDVTNIGWKDCIWTNNTYSDDLKKVFLKYVHTEQAETYWAGSDVVDNLTVLEYDDDAVHANWKNDWHMPKIDEWKVLYEKSHTKGWTSNYKGTGVAGYYLNFEEGKALFLPAAGYRINKIVENRGAYGDYWSSSLGVESNNAYRVFFTAAIHDFGSSAPRYYGFVVRPNRICDAE